MGELNFIPLKANSNSLKAILNEATFIRCDYLTNTLAKGTEQLRMRCPLTTDISLSAYKWVWDDKAFSNEEHQSA